MQNQATETINANLQKIKEDLKPVIEENKMVKITVENLENNNNNDKLL